jgi:hypothetical protein
MINKNLKSGEKYLLATLKTLLSLFNFLESALGKTNFFACLYKKFAAKKQLTKAIV